MPTSDGTGATAHDLAVLVADLVAEGRGHGWTHRELDTMYRETYLEPDERASAVAWRARLARQLARSRARRERWAEGKVTPRPRGVLSSIAESFRQGVESKRNP